MYYYDEFSVLMLVHLFAFAQAALNGRKPRRPGRAHAPERDSWASYLQRHLESLYRRAPNSAARRQQHSRQTRSVFDEG